MAMFVAYGPLLWGSMVVLNQVYALNHDGISMFHLTWAHAIHASNMKFHALMNSPHIQPPCHCSLRQSALFLSPQPQTHGFDFPRHFLLQGKIRHPRKTCFPRTWITMKTHHYRTFRRHTRTHASGTLRVITQHGRCRDVDDVAVYGVG